MAWLSFRLKANLRNTLYGQHIKLKQAQDVELQEGYVFIFS
jgi:hypothetical protein